MTKKNNSLSLFLSPSPSRSLLSIDATPIFDFAATLLFRAVFRFHLSNSSAMIKRKSIKSAKKMKRSRSRDDDEEKKTTPLPLSLSLSPSPFFPGPITDFAATVLFRARFVLSCLRFDSAGIKIENTHKNQRARRGRGREAAKRKRKRKRRRAFFFHSFFFRTPFLRDKRRFSSPSFARSNVETTFSRYHAKGARFERQLVASESG